MKLVKLPSAMGPDWWIIVHDLSLAEGRLRKLRPIHAFAYLLRTLAKSEASQLGNLSFALENKLYAIRIFQYELRKAIAEVNDFIYQGKYVRDYDDEQKVVCVLEAYLNSIYSVLEIVALINRQINPKLPIGFNAQRKKFSFFSFDKWPWLRLFYDLRSQLEHFRSSLPMIEQNRLLVVIDNDKALSVLKKGKNFIAFTDTFKFSILLFKLLDTWAESELSKINENSETDCIEETGLNSPLKIKKIKAKEILDLLKS